MNSLYKNQYRVKSTRLRKWDYSANGYYFTTICTKKKICYFGEIKNQEMIVSSVGKIVEKYWKEIPEHFSHVILDEFVIMPNHVHGIVVIRKNHSVDNIRGGDAINRVSTHAFS